MNTILSPTYRELGRCLNLSPHCIHRLPPFTCQQAFLRTTSVRWYHPRVTSVPDHVHETLRKKYKLSNDYFVIYKEPRPEKNFIMYAKWLELFLYSAPVWGITYPFVYNMTLAEFFGQDDFFIGVGAVCVYLLGIRFFVNGYVKIMFHNRTTDTYRAYVLNKFKPSYKHVEFKAEDLRVVNLPPSIPLIRNLFKAGKQTLVLHDTLFASYNDQEKLIGNAIDQWHAKWKSK